MNDDKFLLFVGILLHIEQAILWLVAAQIVTAVGLFFVALNLERVLRFFRRG